MFLSSADFLQNQPFRKILSGIPSECQTVWIQIRPDYMNPAKKFACIFVVSFFFSKSTVSKNSFGNTIRVSNGLDPDQALHIVGPDQDSICLQKLSADDIQYPVYTTIMHYAAFHLGLQCLPKYPFRGWVKFHQIYSKKICPVFMVLYLLIQLRCLSKKYTKMFIKRPTHKSW